ncbi:MAG TPA: L-threonylcarbamoyladenylate synthase [Mycobacteriales bacterium]|nr:L-threonylcarbamoyladenylate synthase [Mycobacteriales bacterium]
MTDPAQVVETLQAGGIVLLPTDTVYGLAVRPGDDAALARLFALKQRPLTRNIPIMVASPEQAEELGADVTGPARQLLAAFSPGPLTLALGLDPARAPAWLAGRDEIAVRIPDDTVLLEVLRAAGPLLVTSANLSGQDTPEECADVLTQLVGAPDLVIDDGPRATVPSTLVNCNLPEPKVERVGAVPAEQIAKVLS